MKKTLKIKARSVCGTIRGFPDNEDAKKVARLIRPRTTFNNEDLQILAEIGYEIELIEMKTVEVPA